MGEDGSVELSAHIRRIMESGESVSSELSLRHVVVLRGGKRAERVAAREAVRIGRRRVGVEGVVGVEGGGGGGEVIVVGTLSFTPSGRRV